MTHSSTDGDASSLLFWRLVDLTVIHEFTAALFRQVFSNSGGQGGLAVIDVLVHKLSLFSVVWATYSDSTNAALSAPSRTHITDNLLEMRLRSAELSACFRGIAP